MISKKKIYGFDSFEGFPKKSIFDSEYFDNKRKWRYKLMGTDLVKDNLLNIGVTHHDLSTRIHLVKGFYPYSFSNFREPISFLHLDVDLYQSYKYCLEHFYPLLKKGGIILFDEYDKSSDLKKWPGAKIAIDEYFVNKEEKIQRDWTGYSYIIKS